MIEQEYLQRIHELEKQIARLQTEIKKNSETQYGLRWMDVPEAFEAEAENAIPTLEEVPSKAISNDDGKPTHILIEGDNFHALTCLNYTHKGQIDVIYIDPPYNTGSDGFVYKDKRVLDKFPDGTTVPTDHPLRHSYWLSFMHKRLELAKNLLSERGVIFISIDDNELANILILCNVIFGERNFINNFMWLHGKGKKDTWSRTLQQYVIAFAKDKNNLGEWNEKSYTNYDFSNPDNDPKGKWFSGSLSFSETRSNPLHPNYFTIESPTGIKWTRQWQVTKEEMSKLISDGDISWGDPVTMDGVPRQKIRPSEIDIIPNNIIENKGTTKGAQDDLDKMGLSVHFDYPKPVELIAHLLSITNKANNITILDFFAGSGTTMHATMQLNEEDGGHRQCILVQQNENNICEAVTYERNKRVMQGYTNAKGEAVAGLGNSMKYYRTAFVGEHKITDITDADKVALTQKAGCLLALGENNLEEIRTAKSYQIFQLRKGDKPTNDFGYTAVYFSGNLLQFADFRREIEQIQAAHPLTRIAVYVFTWGDPSVFENEFDDLSGITIKPIPQPILEIYQNIHQL